MTERERLIKLIDTPNKADKIRNGGKITSEYPSEILADWLIQNGVIILPCKVGDTVWMILELLKGGQEVVESRCVKITIISDGRSVYSMYINDRLIGNTLEFYDDDFGRTIFLSREEAKKAKERKK